MTSFSRRSLIKGAALPVLGTFALPSLAAAIETNSAPQQRPKLKITDVRTAQVNVHGPQTHIRIYTDQGVQVWDDSRVAGVRKALLRTRRNANRQRGFRGDCREGPRISHLRPGTYSQLR